MATIATERPRPLVSKFYVGMAILFAAIAFGGFFMTYWLQVVRGTFTGSLMLHLHGLLFSLWTLFFLSQALLVADRRLKTHRAWGLFGISLATAMLFTGLAVVIQGMENRIEAGFGEAARQFAIVPTTGIMVFAGFVAAALINLRRPEWHKRFMLIGTAQILQAALARFFFLAATGGGGPGMRPGLGPVQPIERTIGAGLLVDLIIIAAMVHDRRSHGRVHPAYWWGLGVVLAVQALRPVIGRTEAWYRITDILLAF